MLSTAAALAIALAPGGAQPTFDVLTTSRWTDARASGEDADFHDGMHLREFCPVTFGEWISDLDADLADGEGVPVARGATYHESHVEASSLDFTLDAWAETMGEHVVADARGESLYHVTFGIDEPLVRYAVRAGAQLGAGTGTASVRLDGPGGSPFILEPAPGESQALVKTGWLPAGFYTLRGEVAVSASGTLAHPDATAGNAECEFSIHRAGDFELDGDVDLDDRQAYAAAHASGALTADFDGDGIVEPEDRVAFERAWSRTR